MVHLAVHPPSRVRRRVLAALLAGAAALGALVFACRRAATGTGRDASKGTESTASAPAAPARSTLAGSDRTAAETAAVEAFLRGHADLRAAADADRHGSADSDADVKSLYGVYHPYFVRGDVNDDGVLDFVVAFVGREPGRASRFTVVAFLGRSGSSGSAEFSGGTFIERDVSLARGDVSIDRDSIVITPDLDEDAVRRYRWDAAARAFVFVRDSDDDTDPPSVSRTVRRVTPVEF